MSRTKKRTPSGNKSKLSATVEGRVKKVSAQNTNGHVFVGKGDKTKKRRNKQKSKSGKSSARETALEDAAVAELTTYCAATPGVPVDTASVEDQEAMSSPFGSNRLRSGYVQARKPHRSASDSGDSIENGQKEIVISDDEDQEMEGTDLEDGGMTLNVRPSDNAAISISSDEGEVDETDQTTYAFTTAPNIDTQSTPDTPHSPTMHKLPALRLMDLNLDDREEQLRYAFWDLDRGRVDPSRLVRCMHCYSEGHLSKTCPQKSCTHCTGQHDPRLCPKMQKCRRCRHVGHAARDCDGMKTNTIPCTLCLNRDHVEQDCGLKHYTQPNNTNDGSHDLWVSCCNCASNTHLVGDCSTIDLSSSSCERWSLRLIGANMVTNLSLQSGISKLEKQAANRGVRPEGLKIRGRGGQQTPSDFIPSDDGDDENWFSSKSIRARARSPLRNDLPDSDDDGYGSHQGRYDRYEPPDSRQNRNSYRPPRNQFYATDSFGRERTPSPPRGTDAYRPGHAQQGDRYRPAARSTIPPPRGGKSGISIKLGNYEVGGRAGGSNAPTAKKRNR